MIYSTDIRILAIIYGLILIGCLISVFTQLTEKQKESHRKLLKQENMYTIEFYSRKTPFKRRQYYWRAIHWNGNIVATGGEGYNNKQDRNDAFYRFRAGIRDEKFEVKDMDL